MFEHGPTWTWVVAGIFIAVVLGVAAALWLDNTWSTNWTEHFVAGITCSLIVAVFTVGIPIYARAQHAYATWCAGQGGHVDSHTSTNVVPVVNSSGGVSVGVATNTTTYCITADGRI